MRGEKLEDEGEICEIKKRHLEFFAAFAALAQSGIYSTEQAGWFRRLDQDADNLRVAMDWPVLAVGENDSKRHSIQKNQFLIIGSLAMHWERGYRREIIEILKRILALDVSDEQAIERAKALNVGGFLLWSLNDPLGARAYLEESAKIAEGLRDELTLAWSLCYLGLTFDSLGRIRQGKNIFERSLGFAKSLGEDGKYVAGHVMSFLGDIPYWQGNIPEARKLYEEGIAFTRKLNNMNILTSPLRRLAYIEVREGNYAQAAHLLSESLELNRQLGHLQGTVACLAGFAAINLAKGNHDRAAILCGAVENLLERFGGPFFFADTVEYERCAFQVKEKLNKKALSVAWLKGGAMTIDDAISFALNT